MLFRLTGVVLLVLFSASVLSQGNGADKPLKVRAIYPTGEEVASSERITIEFNQNVVSLGASMFVDDVVPIDIEPAVECEWNWVKLNTLQCELPIDSNLARSTKYTVTVRPGIRAPNGRVLQSNYVHTFETVVPSIRYTDLVSWVSPTEPIIKVLFNQKVNLATLKNRVFMLDSITGKEISVKVWPNVGRMTYEIDDDFFGRSQTYKKYSYLDGSEYQRVQTDNVVLLPQETLSAGSQVSLVLLPGVEGATGNLTSKERMLVDAEITTFDEFRLLGLVCQDVHGNDLFLSTSQTQEESCSVQSNFSLVLSSRFGQRAINNFVHSEPSLKRNDGWLFLARWRYDDITGIKYRIVGDFKSSTSYRLYLSPHEKTGAETESSEPVRDGFGRPLIGTNEITFRTGRALPRAYLNSTHTVVDSNGTIEPQIILGNVEDVSITFDTLDKTGVQQSLVQHRPSPREDDVLEAQFLNLRDVLRSSSGIMSGNLRSRPRFDHREEHLESLFFAQATPYSVVLKTGTVRSLAWVVDLQTGEPIANADLEFYLGNPLHLEQVRESIFTGTTDENGLAILPGYEVYDPMNVRAENNFTRGCEDNADCSMYFLRVDGESGMAVLPTDSNYTLNRAYSDGPIYDTLDHWTTTSQSLYMPGDTVQIKGYVRTRRNNVRAIPEQGHFGLCVAGPNGRKYEITPIALNQFGAYHTSLKLNERTEFGEYRFYLIFNPIEPVSEPCESRFGTPGRYSVSNGSFEVFEFKTNPIEVSQELNATVYERGDSLSITTRASFHAGGSYAHASGQVNVRLVPNTPPFTAVSTYSYEISRNVPYQLLSPIYSRRIELNAEGEHTVTIDSIDRDTYYGDLQIENSVISDRGKSVATRAIVPYFGVDRFVAIKRTTAYIYGSFDRNRIRVGEPWPIQVVVVSKDDEIEIGVDVQITVFAAKKDPDSDEQIPWYSSEIEWEEVFDCAVVSAEDPVSCEYTPPESNFYQVEAQILDTRGNIHLSSVYVDARVDHRTRVDPFERIPALTMQLKCDVDEKNVSVGDSIRCKVKNHLGSAPVLVTIERTGVIDEWLVRLDPANPFIEFKVQEEYAPHFKLSVLALSPRSPATLSDDPKYRIAGTQFDMENPRLSPLEVKVSSNRRSYSPRDPVKLSISTKRSRGKRVPIEYAVAVVDEALLDLSTAGGTYFDPTEKTWRVRPNGVRTYGLIRALMEASDIHSSSSPYTNRSVIRDSDPQYSMAGLSPFETDRKTDPDVRKVDRFVAYWNPSAVADDGRLKLNFILPDNLTRWRVMVMAVSAEDRFGYAEMTVSSKKETEVRAVVPNVVTEGDEFQIGASVLNRAERRRKLLVELHATGLLAEGSKASYTQQLDFKPFERRVVLWDVAAGTLPKSLDFQNPTQSSEIQVVASAGDRRDRDALDVRIPVRSSLVRVSSVVYGSLDGDKTSIPVAIPNKVVDDNGQIDFTMTTNEAVNFDGVFRYAIDYPYACWEQLLTQAVLAMQYKQLEARGAKHRVDWPDPDKLIRRVLDSAVDFQAPGGGMAYFIPRNRLVDPYLSAYTALAFSWLENAGYAVPQHVNQNLHEYLRKFLEQERDEPINADWITDQKFFNHVQATVSAVVVNSLALSGELTDEDLGQFSGHINQMDLFGLSQFLMAILNQDSAHPLTKKVVERILNHRSLVDGTVEYVESIPRAFTRILHSDTRSLCSVLEALTLLSDWTSSGIDVGELKELSDSVRYARDNLPRWHSTQDNVFCTKAMLTFFDFVGSDESDLLATISLVSEDTGVSTRLAAGWELSSSVTKLHTQHSLNSQLFGSKGAIEISRKGNATAFYDVELSYLTMVDARINRFSGFELHREYAVRRNKTWQVLKPGDTLNQGEIVAVHLFLNNRFDRHHVVLDDPVPGGLEPINDQLRTEYAPGWDRDNLIGISPTSKWYSDFKDASRGWHFRYREIGIQNVRYFARFIKRGKHHLSWEGQVISAGKFTALPTHVEEMYRPVMFGKSEPWTLTVKPESPR